jgi:hypothetical protein
LVGHLPLVLVHTSSSLGFTLVKPNLGHVLSCASGGAGCCLVVKDEILLLRNSRDVAHSCVGHA